MGKLAERAKQRSPYIRLVIGERTAPMKYKAWKEITSSFGDPSFRYSFEVETPEGFVIKALDNSSESFAGEMDKIPFNATVIISRHPKLDKNGNPIADKSIYKVKLVDRKVDTFKDVQDATAETSEEVSPSSETTGGGEVIGEGEKPGWAEEILNEDH